MKKLLAILTLAAFAFYLAPTTLYAQRHDRGNHKKAHQNRGHQNRGHHKNKRESYRKGHQAHYRSDARRGDHKYAERRHDNHRRDSRYYRKSSHRHHPVVHRHPRGRKMYHTPPGWAKAHRYHARHHVYFRDYHTFYDPYRHGYVYWHQNRWLFSPRLPAFLAHVDLGRARAQIITDIPLTVPPERYYDRYVRSYPPRIHIAVSIPRPF